LSIKKVSRLYRLILSERKPSIVVILLNRHFYVIGILRKLTTVCSSMGGLVIEGSVANHTTLNTSIQTVVEIAIPFVSMVETSWARRLIEFR